MTLKIGWSTYYLSLGENEIDLIDLFSSVEIPLSEGPVNLNWGPIMKTINESPYDFFQQGGWSFLSGTGDDESDHDESNTESEFEADTEELISSEGSDEESDFDGSNASEDSGSASSFDDDGSDGESWDELERKAAKCQFLTSPTT